jgi:hypothetical protein
VVAVLVDQPDGVEHLGRVVGVEAGEDLRDRAEVPVQELAEAAGVVDRARARPSGDEELEIRDAERVLDIDQEQAEPEPVVDGGVQVMLVGPSRCLSCAVLVRDPPDFTGAVRVKMRRNWKLAHCWISL